jgi:opacity protein-like surface antigen
MLKFRRGFALLSAAAMLALSTTVSAQTSVPAAPDASSEIKKPSRDFVMLQFTYEGWNNKPDSIKTSGIPRGFNAYLCYDFPIQKSHFSFAAGIGIGTSNIYFNNQEIRFQDTGAAGSSARFVPESRDYSKYKLTTAYLEAPFELRYFENKNNRNKGFKAAIGARAGLLVGAHAKGVLKVDGNKVAEKINTRRYMEKWRFSATARVGWGNFSLFGSYNINALFAEGSGPDVTPYSIGLCITGL